MAKYYYNGILLPEMPIIENYTYAWIRQNNSSGYYDLILSALQPYLYDSDSMGFGSGTTADIYWYRIEITSASDANEWTLYSSENTWFTIDSNRIVHWSNSDIPYTSSTSTNIYFASSQPISKVQKLKTISIIEAESGVLSGSAIIGDRTESSGNIVVDMITSSGGALTLDFQAPEEGYYLIKMYFTHQDTRQFKYVLNNKTYTKNVIGTTYYGIESIEFQMYLLKGSNPIIFKGGSTTYTPMFDKFEIKQYYEYNTKYLIRSNSKYYTITNNRLTEISVTNLNAEIFTNYGFDTLPIGVFTLDLTDPELLYWQDSNEDLPILTAKVKGAPPLPQIMITQPYNIPTSGIKYVEINATEDILFSISFDGGQSWLYYVADGKDWLQTNDNVTGMTAVEMMAIPQDMWYNVSGTAIQYQIRFILPETTSKVTSITIYYLDS